MKDKDDLVSENIGLVHFVIKRFAKRGQDMEELFQVGCVGLLKAVSGFKEELGLQFSTYAVPVILGEIKRFVRDNTPIHISRGVKEQGIKLKYAIEEFENKYHREPTLNELSQMTGISTEDIVIAREAMRPLESLDAFVYEEEAGRTRADFVGSKECAEEQIINRMLCQEAFRRMSEKEREIVHLRYFENLTQSKVAGLLGMSQVQVSRMEKKIFLRLREEMHFKA